mgnify:FL=1
MSRWNFCLKTRRFKLVFNTALCLGVVSLILFTISSSGYMNEPIKEDLANKLEKFPESESVTPLPSKFDNDALKEISPPPANDDISSTSKEKAKDNSKQQQSDHNEAKEQTDQDKYNEPAELNPVEEESGKQQGEQNAAQDETDDERLRKAKIYFAQIFETLREGHPNCEKIYRVKGKKAEDVGVETIGKSPSPTEEYLRSIIKLTPEQLQKMKMAHNKMVSRLPDKYPENLYKGDGIVYVGGGIFSWYSLLSIRNIRRLGCSLPIEIVIPDEKEYEPELCDKVFPAYGARCVYLPKILDDSVRNNFLFKGYQYKVLALMVSSFENVLLLDADNVPVTSPEPLFRSTPFNETGLVVWPDFWKRTTSPYLYDIAGIKVDRKTRLSTGYATYGHFEKENCPKDKVLFHQYKGAFPDPSSESGQLLISKKKHTKDLWITLYYNMFGPDYFYPLLSQGAAGEGDKETFLAGAHALNRKYYQVRKLVEAVGMFRDGKFHGIAMKQYNAIDDYALSVEYKDAVDQVKESPRFMFLHINFPKLNPAAIKASGLIYDKKTGKRNRLFGKSINNELDYDFELTQWQSMKALICDNNIHFMAFENLKITKDELCKDISSQLDFLIETTTTK